MQFEVPRLGKHYGIPMKTPAVSNLLSERTSSRIRSMGVARLYIDLHIHSEPDGKHFRQGSLASSHALPDRPEHAQARQGRGHVETAVAEAVGAGTHRSTSPPLYGTYMYTLYRTVNVYSSATSSVSIRHAASL